MHDGARNGALLRAVGDVALVGTAARALRDGIDTSWPETAKYMSSADILFANLEMPIPGGPIEPARPDVSHELKGVRSALPAFLACGVDVVALATNHIMDWGETGLVDTMTLLRENDVAFVGAGRTLDEALESVVIERGGVRVGFCAFTPPQRWTATPTTPGAAPLSVENVRASIRRMSDADIRVVSLHWGIEMSNYPTPQDRELAACILDEGADLILGHHPHVIQGVEKMGSGYVAYSMGNFVFDVHAGKVRHNFDPWDLRAGYMVEAVLRKHGITDLSTVPTFLSEHGVGAVASEPERQRIGALLHDVSADIETGSRDVWSHAGTRIVGHKLKVMRGLLRDAGPLFLIRELSHIRLRHVRMLMGFIASRIGRRGSREGDGRPDGA